jgi:hypothetical protein
VWLQVLVMDLQDELKNRGKIYKLYNTADSINTCNTMP